MGTGAEHNGAESAPQDGATAPFTLPQRFHWLDFLRYLAATAVVLHHYYFFYLDGTALAVEESAMIAAFPFEGMRFFYDYGQYAVQFFWVLSGFVFAHTYFARPSDGIGFAAARFARLYPLHFATLVIVAALQITSVVVTGTSQVTANNDLYHFMLQVFFVSAWGMEDSDSFNAPVWSVSAEIATYILFFFLHRNRLFRTAAGQAFAMLAAIGAARLLGSSAVPVCAAFFFAGCLTYTLVQKRRLVDFALAGLLVLLAMRFPFALKLLDTPMTVPLAAFAIAVFAGAWLDVVRLPGGRLAGHFGDFTYSVYLLHFPMILAALVVINGGGVTDRTFLAHPAMLAAYLGSVMAAAFVCYRYFERPADRAIRAYVKAKRARTDPTSAKIRVA